MNQAIRIGDEIQMEPVTSQGDTALKAAGKKRTVDDFRGVVGQDAQGDARVAVVEATPHPLVLSIDDIHHAAARNPLGRLLDHLLKDPWVRRSPGDLQSYCRDVICHLSFVVCSIHISYGPRSLMINCAVCE